MTDYKIDKAAQIAAFYAAEKANKPAPKKTFTPTFDWFDDSDDDMPVRAERKPVSGGLFGKPEGYVSPRVQAIRNAQKRNSMGVYSAGNTPAAVRKDNLLATVQGIRQSTATMASTSNQPKAAPIDHMAELVKAMNKITGGN